MAESKEKKKEKKVSLKDYFSFGNRLISKKLVLVILLVLLILIIIAALIIKSLMLTRTFYEDSIDKKYSGKVRIIDRDKNTIYKGGFENGKYNGKGMFYSDSHLLFYEGDFKDGMFDGYGIIYKAGGETRKYEGEFKNNQMNGVGVYYQNNKKRFEGIFENTVECTEYNFLDGIMGEGLKYHDDGKTLAYKGNFLFGKFDGKGIKFNDDEKNSILYVGDFLNGAFEGSGKIFGKEENLLYDGEFKKGEYNGQGTLYNNTGMSEVFTGSFCDGNIDYFSMFGLSLKELKSKLVAHPIMDVDDRYMYMTYKDIGSTFVLDIANDSEKLTESNNGKVIKVILWNYLKFANVFYRSNEDEFIKTLGEPIYSGLSSPVFEDRIALKNINRLTLNKEDVINPEVLNVLGFNYKEYSLTAVFGNQKQGNLYLIISE